jgi:hypothetical protein
MRSSVQEQASVRDYFAHQLEDDPVVHLEKVAVERVGSVVHDIWDVHCRDSRWWAVSNPLHRYSQDDFKSRDVVLTFHVGLAVRVVSQEHVPVADTAAALLPTAWRLWEQAVEMMTTGREAEDFQAVGVRLRECLVSYAGEVASDDLVPEGEGPPKGGLTLLVGPTCLLSDLHQALQRMSN